MSWLRNILENIMSLGVVLGVVSAILVFSLILGSAVSQFSDTINMPAVSAQMDSVRNAVNITCSEDILGEAVKLNSRLIRRQTQNEHWFWDLSTSDDWINIKPIDISRCKDNKEQ